MASNKKKEKQTKGSAANGRASKNVGQSQKVMEPPAKIREQLDKNQ